DTYLRDNKSPGAFQNYMRDITSTLEQLKLELIRDKPDMSMAEFLPILEKFASLGLAPRQTLKMDFTNSRDGFDIEIALKFLRNAKLNEKSDSYQLITHNCAVFIRDLLIASTTNPKLKHAFDS